uniref:Uncharacterized protein n=1 Tax=Sphaerodactylus townsendi TaxID=933632 RepID=A0ACB8EM55_9SAUR
MPFVQTRKEYKKYFRSGASANITTFIYQSLVQKFLLALKNNLPSMTVTDHTWPAAPYKFLTNANQELKKIFHHWRVRD